MEPFVLPLPPPPVYVEHTEDAAGSVVWQRWARDELARGQIQLAQLHQLQLDLDNERRKVKAAEVQIAKGEEALKGLRNYLDHLRDKSTSAFDLGTKVIVKRLGIESKVEGVCVDATGVSYYLYWWDGNSFDGQWLPAAEVENADGPLPVPGD